ncbi:alpha/beta hydrolase [Rhodopseudomonas sp. HC1]|uniref:alpha/beta hydrolase n=1 Tax=Rhodopseudomonas infernalis TaxID=2897386 RepID=UPI001EE85C06|nr:alpha/beta hydrolase [Rhodopseudomonas infernalis]MCG6205265.1 alpha/beta hydrolase [Rhodopseudomonas infernalis]
MQDVAPPAIPAELRTLMAEIGPKWATNTKGHIQLMIDEFSELLKHSPKRGVDVQPNITYGPHERQAFDVYRPHSPSQTPRPGLIFVHGGAFTEGRRDRSSEIYANVLYYFARHGIVGINAGYRLAPEARYPEATRDIAKVVAWMRANATDLGVDPERIFLMGHSAGGAHVGSYAFDRRHQADGGHGLAGVLIISGRVRADSHAHNPNALRVAEYYGSDAAVHEDVSPVSHVDATSPPTLIACAEFENPLIDVYCFELAYRLGAAKRKAPPFMWLKGHNHTSIIGQFNTAEDALGRACLNFIRATG